LTLGGTASAQDLSGLARLDPIASSIRSEGGGVRVVLAISQPVPWRVRLLDEPPRLILDVREVDWTRIADVPQTAALVRGVRAGSFRPGWSRLVLELSGPMRVMRAGMATGTGPARIDLWLERSDAAEFARAASLPEPPGWAAPIAGPPPERPPTGGPIMVMLDPGHGGIDPGAERDGLTEAGLMLNFARELKEVLVRRGLSVAMTRDEDVFVPLETRITLAREAGAHLFLSLHADALPEGEAVGATLYTLADTASDAAAAALAERHDRDDLLSGVDLTGQDDLVATVLMDIARTETAPRTDRLAQALETAIQGENLVMHRMPRQTGGFSVLKAPDIPSVLIELGFMSSAGDLARLTDPAWRARMAGAIANAIDAWAIEDAALRDLVRR